MSVKLLTEHHLEFLSLTGGCIASSESTLVEMPHCWKSYDVAHILVKSRSLQLLKSAFVIMLSYMSVQIIFQKWLGNLLYNMRLIMPKKCLEHCIVKKEQTTKKKHLTHYRMNITKK